MVYYDLYGIGNALVDTEYKVSEALLASLGVEKGMMTLIDDIQLAEVELQLRDQGSLIKQSSGGSAANSMIAAANFGSSVFYSCKVANDELGTFYYEDLIASGVATNLHKIKEQGTTGRCLVMITNDAERTMNTHLGITGNLGSHEIDETALRASNMLYIEGYLASSEKTKDAAIRAHQIAKDSGIQVALTFSDPSMVTYFKDQIIEIVGNGVDLLFCNENEAMAWTKKETAEDAMSCLTNTAGQWICTRGALGATVFDGQSQFDIPGRKVKPVDTNGAGDMCAGAFLYGHSSGWSFEKSARFGMYTSGHLVTQFGPRLPLAAHVNLLQEFQTRE